MSPVLCMATVGLWVRSHFANDWLGRVNYTPGIPSEDHHLWLSANLGMFEVVGDGDPAENFSRVQWERRRFPVDRDWRGLRRDGPPIVRMIGMWGGRPAS